jgi:hypothetical protein
VLAAGEQVEATVSGLDEGEVAVGVGLCGIAGRDEAAVRPGFALVVADGGKEADAGELAFGAKERSAMLKIAPLRKKRYPARGARKKQFPINSIEPGSWLTPTPP